MNQQPDNKDSDAIRSEIDSTRQRMDSTIDALEKRFKGRHLLDEVIGFFRPRSEELESDEMVGKIKDTASTAARAVVNTVRANPVPTLLVGAGVAWMIYQSRRSANPPSPEHGGGSDDEYDDASASDLGYDIPESSFPTQPEFYKKDLGAKPPGAVGSKLEDMKQAINEKVAEIKERLNEATSKAGERAGEMYINRRDQVVGIIAKHPLEVAAGCLVAGLAVGLCLPTVEKVDEVVGPTSDRLKRKAREAGQDLAQRGRRVVQAATTAMRKEAEAQGLTPESLRNKAGAVAARAREAASETAEKEGILPPTSEPEESDSAKNEPPSPSV